MPEKESPQLRFTTVPVVAQVLGFNRNTVIRLLETGELPGLKLGGRWRIPIEPLSELLGVDPSVFETSVTHRYPDTEAVA